MSVGFEAMASPTVEVYGIIPLDCFVNSNLKIWFCSIRFVGEAAALFPRSTPKALSFFGRPTRDERPTRDGIF
ncbi:MAG TPA: hypothetical protein VIL78_17155 [Hanamia sp.]